MVIAVRPNWRVGMPPSPMMMLIRAIDMDHNMAYQPMMWLGILWRLGHPDKHTYYINENPPRPAFRSKSLRDTR